MACKLIAVSGMAFEARIARADGICTVYGLNPAILESSIEEAIGDGASALLSFGTAAGLTANMRPGAIIVARRILYQQQACNTDAAWAGRLCAALPEAQLADIAGVDEPLVTTQAKSLLGALAPVADMESHRVARIASKHGLPFAAIRVVLDDITRALPPAALVSLRANGTIDYLRLLQSLLTQPSQLPSLLQLATDSNVAKKSLLRCGELLRDGLFAMNIR